MNRSILVLPVFKDKDEEGSCETPEFNRLEMFRLMWWNEWDVENNNIDMTREFSLRFSLT